MMVEMVLAQVHLLRVVAVVLVRLATQMVKVRVVMVQPLQLAGLP